MTQGPRRLNENDEVKIGIIGCGGVVESYHLPVLASIPEARIKWVCDASLERAGSVARSWGIGQAFGKLEDCSDVDVVLVATPVGTRREILSKTAERGWHTFCEKPFASNPKEHLDMLEFATRAGVKFGAGYVRRYLWAVEQARDIVRSKVLGQLKQVVASEYMHLQRTGVDMSSYRNSVKASGGGVLLETGCHLVDEVFFMTDTRAVDVRACSQKTWNDYEVETVSSADLTLGSGEQVPLRLEVSGIRPMFSGVGFRCELGELRLHLDRAKGLEVFLGQGLQCRLEVPTPRPGEPDVIWAFRREWLYFLNAVRTTNTWDHHWETGLMTTEFIMRCGEVGKGSYVGVQG